MSDYEVEVLIEAIVLFLKADEKTKAFVVDFLKSSELRHGQQNSC